MKKKRESMAPQHRIYPEIGYEHMSQTPFPPPPAYDIRYCTSILHKQEKMKQPNGQSTPPQSRKKIKIHVQERKLPKIIISLPTLRCSLPTT